jgi:hypothetical protein
MRHLSVYLECLTARYLAAKLAKPPPTTDGGVPVVALSFGLPF